VKMGGFIQTLQSSLRLEGLDWNPYNTKSSLIAWVLCPGEESLWRHLE
jgi:hypothetical protein